MQHFVLFNINMFKGVHRYGLKHKIFCVESVRLCLSLIFRQQRNIFHISVERNIVIIIGNIITTVIFLLLQEGLGFDSRQPAGFISTSKRLERVWGPPSLPSYGYRE